MADDIFEAKIRNAAGVVVIDLAGEMNGQAERGLIDVYNNAERMDPRFIVLNFSKVNYINSTGIALIVNILARSRKKNLELRIYGLSQHYKEIFNITRLTDYLKVFPDELSALNVG